MELFFPPRFSKEARRQGLDVPPEEEASWDLTTGWDVFCCADRQRFCEALARYEPELLTRSPECKMFSSLMHSNVGRMDPVLVQVLRERAIYMITFALLAAVEQHRRDRFILFDHPLFASSWHLELTRWVGNLSGMEFVRVDMCMFGLQVSPLGLSKKPTGLLTNCFAVARRLERSVCLGLHSHVQLQHGLPAKAQVYPHDFVLQVLAGLREELAQKRSRSSFPTEDLNEDATGAEERDDDEDDVPEDLRPAAASVGEEAAEELTDGMKRLVEKVHVNLGHPPKLQFLRALKAARANYIILKYVADSFRRSACEAHARPRPRRRAALPRTYAFNKVVAVDLFYLRWQGGSLPC